MYKIAVIKLVFIVLVYKHSIGQQNTESVLSYDELQKGIAVEKSPSSYLASDDAVYSIGDFITIGTPVSNKTFGYFVISDGFMYRREVPITVSGQKVEIKSIVIKGSTKTGFYVVIRCRGMIKGVMDIGTFIEIQLENAIMSGEIIPLGYTSDKALAELKKAKDKLDLGLITQENYDALKSKLAKYID